MTGAVLSKLKAISDMQNQMPTLYRHVDKSPKVHNSAHTRTAT